jgi:hypothetical protein
MTVDETPSDTGFLRPATPSPGAERLFADDRRDVGYVMNLSHAWTHQPEAHDAFMDLLGQASAAAGLSFRQRAVLVTASAGVLGDPHCSLAWGRRLAAEVGDDVAAAVLGGEDGGWLLPTQPWRGGRGSSPAIRTARRRKTSSCCGTAVWTTRRSPP